MNSDPLFAASHKGDVMVWAVAQGPSTPTACISVSKKPNHILTWNPRSRDVLAVAGESGSIKLLDLRTPDGLCWRAANAHTPSVDVLAWSPLVPSWMASSGPDGIIKIWDTRLASAPVYDMGGGALSAPLTGLAWSQTHAEVLASTASDATLALWSLTEPSHHVMAEASVAALSPYPLTGIVASGSPPDAFHAVAMDGTLFSFAIDPELETRLSAVTADAANGEFSSSKPTAASTAIPSSSSGLFASPSSSNNNAAAPHGHAPIWDMLYRRDFEAAFAAIVDGATDLQAKHRNAEAAALLDLCVPRTALSIESIFSSSVTHLSKDAASQQFFADLVDFARHIPPNFPSRMASLPSQTTRDALAKLNLALRLDSWVSSRDVAALQGASESIIRAVSENLVAGDVLRVSIGNLTAILDVLLSNGTPQNAMDFGIQLGSLFSSHGRWNEFLPLASLLLSPTIFDAKLLKLAAAAAARQAPQKDVLVLPGQSLPLRKPRGSQRGGARGESRRSSARGTESDAPAAAYVSDDARVHAAALDSALSSDPAYVLSQLRLEKNLRARLARPNWAEGVIDLVDESGILEAPRRFLSIHVHEAYLQALLALGQIGAAYIYCTRMARAMEGFAASDAFAGYLSESISPALDTMVAGAVSEEDPDVLVEATIDVAQLVFHLPAWDPSVVDQLSTWLQSLCSGLESGLENLCMQSTEGEQEAVLIAKDLIEDLAGLSKPGAPSSLTALVKEIASMLDTFLPL